MRFASIAASWSAMRSAQVIAIALLLAASVVAAWARWALSGAGGPGAPELTNAPDKVVYPTDAARAQELARRGHPAAKAGGSP